MRILIGAFVLFIAFAALAATEAEVIATVRKYNPAPLLRHEVSLSGGRLLGFEGGEWGGALIFVDNQGTATKLSTDNIVGLAKSGDRALVFSGLAHMGGNDGELREFRLEGGLPTIVSRRVLEGCASDIRQIDEHTVSFLVYRGHRRGQEVYDCKSLRGGLIQESQACAVPGKR